MVKIPPNRRFLSYGLCVVIHYSCGLWDFHHKIWKTNSPTFMTKFHIHIQIIQNHIHDQSWDIDTKKKTRRRQKWSSEDIFCLNNQKQNSKDLVLNNFTTITYLSVLHLFVDLFVGFSFITTTSGRKTSVSTVFELNECFNISKHYII